MPADIDADLLPGQVLCGRVTHVNADDERIHVALETSVLDELSEQLAQLTAEPRVSDHFISVMHIERCEEEGRRLVT